MTRAGPTIDSARAIKLDTYTLLGRSGLRISPLALGTMTFGTEWGGGADAAEARRIFDAYVDRGGNFVDSANVYAGGTAERLVGEFAAGRRDRLVIATKYTMATSPGDPNSGGNHRKSLVRAIEASLERLATDYVDLLYVHSWDGITPAEEALRALDDLVRAGKVLYVGVSNTPAWQAARLHTIAELRGWTAPIALQVKYNLAERTAERELVPMARELGIGVVAWSPLASGVLTGKYGLADLPENGTRVSMMRSRKGFAIVSRDLTERGLEIAEAVAQVAAEVERSPAEVALAWTLRNPAITAPVIGARTLAQLEENLGALDVMLSDEQVARLDDATAIELGFPQDYLARPLTRHLAQGGTTIAT